MMKIQFVLIFLGPILFLGCFNFFKPNTGRDWGEYYEAFRAANDQRLEDTIDSSRFVIDDRTGINYKVKSFGETVWLIEPMIVNAEFERPRVFVDTMTGDIVDGNQFYWHEVDSLVTPEDSSNQLFPCPKEWSIPNLDDWKEMLSLLHPSRTEQINEIEFEKPMKLHYPTSLDGEWDLKGDYWIDEHFNNSEPHQLSLLEMSWTPEIKIVSEHHYAQVYCIKKEVGN